jgi:two-component system phosphate regulon sensor histidine kinase PhoR
MMNKLLSFTQLENKAIILQNEPIFIYPFCQNIVDEYHIKYPQFKITFSIEGLEEIQADPTFLYSIFTNLIDNAYKYSYPDNRVLEIKLKKFRKNLVMQFIDQGIGIPSDELENIFRKFYRLENEFNQHGSAGIGLAFCKELVNFMKGEISVKSKVGKGSEFKIILPLET